MNTLKLIVVVVAMLSPSFGLIAVTIYASIKHSEKSDPTQSEQNEEFNKKLND